ncbi:MAG TPA: M20/M25/M40 family metallo-hydrolase, partial [Anaerolineales bacterium]|nr:M20/M25/M40 family metallo-hydrolase [Anaerolineales bacterium]
MISETESRVLTLIEQHQADLIASLQQMIRYRTVTPDIEARAEGDDYRAHQKYIRTLLDNMGFETEMWEIDAAQLEDAPGRGVRPEREMSGMPVVVGQLPSGKEGRSLILNGHYDVVPEGDTTLWAHPPYSATIENGKMFGRGTA